MGLEPVDPSRHERTVNARGMNMHSWNTVSNGRPERKDLTEQIEEWKRKQAEDDKKAEAQRTQQMSSSGL
jgi:hypothetical protein